RPPSLPSLSLHDALPIYDRQPAPPAPGQEVVLDPAAQQVVEDLVRGDADAVPHSRELLHVRDVEVADAGMTDLRRAKELREPGEDRKSTRLNSSHVSISY